MRAMFFHRRWLDRVRRVALWHESLRAGVLVLPAIAPGVLAQQLPIRSWSAREGLVHDRVNAFLEDRSGYLWIATWEGVSRFDGREFVNYGPAEGLSSALAFDLAEDPEGGLWVGVFGAGVARLLDLPEERASSAGSRFATFVVGEGRANDVNEIAFDAEDGMWVCTAAGIHRAIGDPKRPRFELVWGGPRTIWAPQAVVAGPDRLWLVGPGRVLEIRDGTIAEHPGPPGGARRDAIHAEPSVDGRAVIATSAGLFVFDESRARAGHDPWTKLDVAIAEDEIVHATAIDPQGRVWVGTVNGILCVDNGRSRRITTANGLPDDWLRVLHVGRDGRLWIGTQQRGIARLDEEWIVEYRWRDSPGSLGIVHVVESLAGEIVVSANDQGLFRVVDGGLERVAGSDEPRHRDFGVGYMQDSRGTWWFDCDPELMHTTGEELDLASLRPASGLSASVFGYMHEDPRGTLWFGGEDGRLYQGAASESGSREFQAGPSLPVEGAARLLFTDRRGWLWIAPYDGLWRSREGSIERVELTGELPDGGIRPRALLEDRDGRLWIGWRFGGISVLDDPAAEAPRSRAISIAEGLPSGHVQALCEDRDGRIWAGTGRGLVRIDPRTLALATITPMQGLAGSTVNDLLVDRAGFLWVAALGGLSRIRTDHEPEQATAREVRILRLEAGGRPVSLPERGASRVGEIVIGPDQSSVVLAYGAVDPENGESLFYQVLLDGLEESWSAPTRERSVRLGPLGPGTYRLLVRATTSDGNAAGEPASVELTVLAPVWRRPWFLAALALLAVALGVTIHRARVRRMVALERVRAGISADLHDEVGSGLAQIAILSELARREATPAASSRLGEVAEVARSTRSSMADLVWAIDPRKDSLLDLVRRMRQTTGNLFEADGLALAFRSPPEQELRRVELGPNERRHLFHVFQEAATNAARHAGASSVEIDIQVEGSELAIVIADDGRGFDPAAVAAGHGLAGMRERARLLRADLSIESAAGRGTRVELRLRRLGQSS